MWPYTNSAATSGYTTLRWPVSNTITVTNSTTAGLNYSPFDAVYGYQVTAPSYPMNINTTASTRPRPSNADPQQRLAEEIAYARKRQEEADALMKALDLLLDSLSMEQCEVLNHDGYVPVVGASGARYRVLWGQVRNVVEVDERGLAMARWCCRPGGNNGPGVPDPDAMLAQVLLLQTDDQEFKRLANYVGAA